jgi:hypothetical protein
MLKYNFAWIPEEKIYQACQVHKCHCNPTVHIWRSFRWKETWRLLLQLTFYQILFSTRISAALIPTYRHYFLQTTLLLVDFWVYYLIIWRYQLCSVHNRCTIFISHIDILYSFTNRSFLLSRMIPHLEKILGVCLSINIEVDNKWSSNIHVCLMHVFMLRSSPDVVLLLFSITTSCRYRSFLGHVIETALFWVWF